MGACASKLCTGSTFPLVEIMLRMVLRAAVAVRTGSASPRDMNDASNTTAPTIPAAHTSQRFRARKPVLFPVTDILLAERNKCTTYGLRGRHAALNPLDAGFCPQQRKFLMIWISPLAAV